MFVQQKIIVTIDPVEEYEVMQKYKSNPKWRCICETSCAMVFTKDSELLNFVTPVYLEEGGDDG